MKKIILVFALLIVAELLFAQERTLSGHVASADDGSALPGVSVTVKGTLHGTTTDGNGNYSLTIPAKEGVLVFSFIGMVTQEIKIGTSNVINVSMTQDVKQLNEPVVVGYGLEGKVSGVQITSRHAGREHKRKTDAKPQSITTGGFNYSPSVPRQEFNTEEYDLVNENIFQDALKNPLSTFSIDVDAASYSNVRRFITSGQRPPKEAVRIEEMINYFDYDYPQPKGEDPFSIYTEISAAPWNTKHKLVHIGLQGRTIATDNLPASNLVFLIDVSGSMDAPNKLPLLKASFLLLADQLREQDRVAIVVYAGAAGLVLPSTSGSDKETIKSAIENLQAGGSTAGGEGIRLAYAIAKENFKKEGNNRIILATDGDFNIGESSNGAMEQLISEKRQDGIFLTVLGYGMGNYKDSKMEILADKGNGNYAYIDNLLEAQKVLVSEFGGTLFTIAKDVKLQIEFNPAKVKAYRLIGYENRMLRNEDFNNDKKDAGELGSGHTVTALYEIIPVGVESDFFKIDELKYQQTKIEPNATVTDEWMTVKFRYKKPNEEISKMIEHTVSNQELPLTKTSDNFKWSASVAAFGMLLRESEYVKNYSLEEVIELAKSAKGEDTEGYRSEFIKLAKTQQLSARR